MMSMHSSTHSSQMNTVGPAMSLRTSCWLLPQKEQYRVFFSCWAIRSSHPRREALESSVPTSIVPVANRALNPFSRSEHAKCIGIKIGLTTSAPHHIQWRRGRHTTTVSHQCRSANDVGTTWPQYGPECSIGMQLLTMMRSDLGRAGRPARLFPYLASSAC